MKRTPKEAAMGAVMDEHSNIRHYIAQLERGEVRKSVNHGLRKVEYMLAAEHPIVDGLFSTRVEWERVPDISQRDLDVIECMIIWWSTPQAERLRRVAEPLIEAEQRKASSRLFAAAEADAPDASLHATHM